MSEYIYKIPERATSWVSLEKLSSIYFFSSTKFSRKHSLDACHLRSRSFDESCYAMTSTRPLPASHEKDSRLVLSEGSRGTSRLAQCLSIRIWGGREGSSPWRDQNETEKWNIVRVQVTTDRTEIDCFGHGHTPLNCILSHGSWTNAPYIHFSQLQC